MLRTRTLFVIHVTMFVAISALAGAAQEAPFHWTGRLQPGQMLAIKSIVGTITVDPVATETVEVTAVKSGEGAKKVHIQLVPTSAGVSICAIYPQATGGSQAVCGAETVWCQNECDGRGPRVDFIIHLPHSIRLLNLVSVNGSITGRFSKENWPGQLNIRTINGNITLQMPPDVNTDLELQIPRRHLRSDFVLSGARARKYGGRVDALIGNGGGSLKISTVGGYVALRRNNLSPTSRVVPVRQTAHTGA